jgi:hypothetical protein
MYSVISNIHVGAGIGGSLEVLRWFIPFFEGQEAWERGIDRTTPDFLSLWHGQLALCCVVERESLGNLQT